MNKKLFLLLTLASGSSELFCAGSSSRPGSRSGTGSGSGTGFAGRPGLAADQKNSIASKQDLTDERFGGRGGLSNLDFVGRDLDEALEEISNLLESRRLRESQQMSSGDAGVRREQRDAETVYAEAEAAERAEAITRAREAIILERHKEAEQQRLEEYRRQALEDLQKQKAQGDFLRSNGFSTDLGKGPINESAIFQGALNLQYRNLR